MRERNEKKFVFPAFSWVPVPTGGRMNHLYSAPMNTFQSSQNALKEDFFYQHLSCIISDFDNQKTFRYRTACKLQDDAMMMISSMEVLGSYRLCLPVRWVCSWPCGIHGNERHSRCLRSQLSSSSFFFVRSLSCLSSNTSTNQYCSLLLHDDSKESLSTRRSSRR
jgi:hypothetical protein